MVRYKAGARGMVKLAQSLESALAGAQDPVLEALTSVAHAILVTVQRGARRMRCVGVHERRVVLDLVGLGPSAICTRRGDDVGDVGAAVLAVVVTSHLAIT